MLFENLLLFCYDNIFVNELTFHFMQIISSELFNKTLVFYQKIDQMI